MTILDRQFMWCDLSNVTTRQPTRHAGTIRQFVARFEHAPVIDRPNAPLYLLGDFAGGRQRVHARARTGYALDIEAQGDGTTPPCFEEVVGRVRQLGIAALVHTTGKHTAEAPRLRVVAFVEVPTILRNDAEAKADRLVALGLSVDLSLAWHIDSTKLIVEQPLFFARRQAENIDYRHAFVEGRRLSAKDIRDFALKGRQHEELIATLEAEGRDHARAFADETRAERQACRERRDRDGPSPIETFNQTHEIEALLVKYGYHRRGQNWRSPFQSSDSFATRIFEDQNGRQWFSLSASDVAAGLGRPTRARNGCWGDAFDLYVHFEHRGNRDAALALITNAWRQDRMRERQWRASLSDDDFGEDPATRRMRQQTENEEIGEGDGFDGLVGIVTLHEALSRFVLIADGSRVSDMLCPRADLSLHDFRNKMAASTMPNPMSRGTAAEVSVVSVWVKSPERLTASKRTFRPSAPVLCHDPEGLDAFNTWRPRVRPEGIDAALADPFIEHVQFIFADAAESFLDWLAHIEQKPGELPHTAWLNIAPKTGLGRNWIASVLARVWTGNVAANVDLPALLDGGFNGRLSAKYLAIVDEIREGGSENSWRAAERLKSLVTEEHRLINPKYGRQSMECNVCRWLLFSNHHSALKLSDSDRRFNVSLCEHNPKPADYYQRLYGLLKMPRFVEAVAAMLGQRDLTQFNPGARAAMSRAKAEVLATSKSEWQQLAEMIRDHWPADVIRADQIRDIFDGHDSSNAAVRHALEDAGIRSRKLVKVNGKAIRVSMVRDHERWTTASGPDIDLHLSGKVPDASSSREGGWKGYLFGIAADAEEAVDMAARRQRIVGG